MWSTSAQLHTHTQAHKYRHTHTHFFVPKKAWVTFVFLLWSLYPSLFLWIIINIIMSVESGCDDDDDDCDIVTYHKMMFMFLTDGRFYIQVNLLQRCYKWRERDRGRGRERGEIPNNWFNAAFTVVVTIILIIIFVTAMVSPLLPSVSWEDEDQFRGNVECMDIVFEMSTDKKCE